MLVERLVTSRVETSALHGSFTEATRFDLRHYVNVLVYAGSRDIRIRDVVLH